MADSYTANLNLTLPEVGASRDTWGGKVNADMTAIDTVFNAAGNGTSVGLNVGAGKTLTVAGTAQFADGSASAPTIAHSGDTNTGVFFPAADTVAITTAGSERARIDSSGNIIVGGTTASAAGLNVQAGYNISFAEGSANTTYTNFFRQSSSAAAVIGYGLKYSTTANGFASSVGSSLARSAIVADGGVIKLYTDSASTVASGTDITPTERARIDSSGNVGIGQTSPTKKLCVANSGAAEISLDPFGRSGETATSILSYNRSTSAYIPIHIDGSVQQFYTSGTEKMRIDGSGNVGIATASPGAKLHVAGSIKSGTGVNSPNSQIMVNTVSGTAAGIQLYQDGNESWVIANPASSTALTFAASGNERARITNSGELCVGLTTSAASAKLNLRGAGSTNATYIVYVENSSQTNTFAIEGDGRWFTGRAATSPYNNTTASAANMYVDSNGILYRSTSSLKYKTDVQDATHGLNNVMQLRPVTYKGKKDGDKIFGGLIAEEVHDAGLTEFVQYAEDGTPDALAYGNMVSLCIKAIQELKAELDAANARIAALEAK